MQTALCMLLLTWGAFAAPQNPKAARSYEGDQTELNTAVQSTKILLAKVADFMGRITDLTRNSERLTSTEAITLLPEFVVEAVKLRDALEANPVKSEDSEAVERVKELITLSLRTFAQRYDEQATAQSDPAANPEPEPEPEPLADVTEAAVEAFTDEPQPEVTTVLQPSEAETYEVENEVIVVENEDEVVDVAPLPKPINSPFAPVNSPFSNSQAFRFSNPIRNHVQGPAPIVKLLPSGGYYVYYNQGR